tara:strand:+ start:4554 stop:4760 length:207 start_codon:yes stop_codon:yes gene_type:complete
MNYNIFDLIIPVLIFFIILHELKIYYDVSIIKRKKTPFENRIKINAFVFLVLGSLFLYKLLFYNRLIF